MKKYSPDLNMAEVLVKVRQSFNNYKDFKKILSSYEQMEEQQVDEDDDVDITDDSLYNWPRDVEAFRKETFNEKQFKVNGKALRTLMKLPFSNVYMLLYLQ